MRSVGNREACGGGERRKRRQVGQFDEVDKGRGRGSRAVSSAWGEECYPCPQGISPLSRHPRRPRLRTDSRSIHSLSCAGETTPSDPRRKTELQLTFTTKREAAAAEAEAEGPRRIEAESAEAEAPAEEADRRAERGRAAALAAERVEDERRLQAAEERREEEAEEVAMIFS